MERANGRHALAATGLGILVIAWGTLTSDLPAGGAWPAFALHAMVLGLTGTLTILGSGWLLSRFSPARAVVIEEE